MSATSKDASALAEDESSPPETDEAKEPASKKQEPGSKPGLMRRLYDWCLGDSGSFRCYGSTFHNGWLFHRLGFNDDR